MRRVLTILLLMLTLAPSVAQNSKKVKDLKSQKAKLQQDLKKSQRDLSKTRADVQKGQQNIKVLDREIEMRVQYIHNTEQELDSLGRREEALKREVEVLDSILKEKKEKYVRSLRMAQAYRKVHSSLLFIFSAKDISQMYRRLRYTREYAAHQRKLGEDVQAKQIDLLERQNELLSVKSETNQKMSSLIAERSALAKQQVAEKQNVSGLEKKQKGLQKQVNDQSKQIAALQQKIDQVIAYEIEQARKKAEAEAKRKAEEKRKAEAKRKAEEERKRNASKGKTGTGGSNTSKSSDSGSKSSASSSSSGSSNQWLTAEDQKLNGSFEQNKGRLPVPITGQYMIGSRYGSNLSDQSHVTLENKGTNYVGKSGARARAIFEGEVTAVISLNGMKHVLVRHGSYISVYCNLSSVIVAKGQKVKACDLLGTVADDGTGKYTLHFQLRKETTRLNPEVWLGR